MYNLLPRLLAVPDVNFQWVVYKGPMSLWTPALVYLTVIKAKIFCFSVEAKDLDFPESLTFYRWSFVPLPSLDCYGSALVHEDGQNNQSNFNASRSWKQCCWTVPRNDCCSSEEARFKSQWAVLRGSRTRSEGEKAASKVNTIARICSECSLCLPASNSICRNFTH